MSLIMVDGQIMHTLKFLCINYFAFVSLARSLARPFSRGILSDRKWRQLVLHHLPPTPTTGGAVVVVYKDSASMVDDADAAAAAADQLDDNNVARKRIRRKPGRLATPAGPNGKLSGRPPTISLDGGATGEPRGAKAEAEEAQEEGKCEGPENAPGQGLGEGQLRYRDGRPSNSPSSSSNEPQPPPPPGGPTVNKSNYDKNLQTIATQLFLKQGTGRTRSEGPEPSIESTRGSDKMIMDERAPAAGSSEISNRLFSNHAQSAPAEGQSRMEREGGKLNLCQSTAGRARSSQPEPDSGEGGGASLTVSQGGVQAARTSGEEASETARQMTTLELSNGFGGGGGAVSCSPTMGPQVGDASNLLAGSTTAHPSSHAVSGPNQSPGRRAGASQWQVGHRAAEPPRACTMDGGRRGMQRPQRQRVEGANDNDDNNNEAHGDLSFRHSGGGGERQWSLSAPPFKLSGQDSQAARSGAAVVGLVPVEGAAVEHRGGGGGGDSTAAMARAAATSRSEGRQLGANGKQPGVLKSAGSCCCCCQPDPCDLTGCMSCGQCLAEQEAGIKMDCIDLQRQTGGRRVAGAAENSPSCYGSRIRKPEDCKIGQHSQFQSLDCPTKNAVAASGSRCTEQLRREAAQDVSESTSSSASSSSTTTSYSLECRLIHASDVGGGGGGGGGLGPAAHLVADDFEINDDLASDDSDEASLSAAFPPPLPSTGSSTSCRRPAPNVVCDEPRANQITPRLEPDRKCSGHWPNLRNMSLELAAQVPPEGPPTTSSIVATAANPSPRHQLGGRKVWPAKQEVAAEAGAGERPSAELSSSSCVIIEEDQAEKKQQQPPTIRSARSLDLRRKFRVLGQLVSFVQISRNFNSSSSAAETSQSGDEEEEDEDEDDEQDERGQDEEDSGRRQEQRGQGSLASGNGSESSAAQVNSGQGVYIITGGESKKQLSINQSGLAAGKQSCALMASGALPPDELALDRDNKRHQASLERQEEDAQRVAAAAGAEPARHHHHHHHHHHQQQQHHLHHRHKHVTLEAGGGLGARGDATISSARRRANADIKREKKAAKTLAIITGVFVCCWLPFFLNAIIMPICGPSCTPSDLILSILLWLGYLNSLLNPIIYTIFSPDFRLAFRRLLCWPAMAATR